MKNESKQVRAGVQTLTGLLIVLCILCVSAASQNSLPISTNPPIKRLVGDYGYWSKYQTPAYGAAQIPFSKVTHIIHFGVSFGSDGVLAVPDGFLEPELIQQAHAAGVKVLVGLGGNFSEFDGNRRLMGQLASNLWAFISQNEYDGVDIDWEYPVAQEAKTFYGLMAALRAVLPGPNYLISADVPPWGGDGYALRRVEPLLDFFNIMMYDCAGPWTQDGQLNSEIFWDASNPDPWECQPGGSAEDAIRIFTIDNGVAPFKLNMGTPFYGYLYYTVSQLWQECSNASHTKDGNCDNAVVSVNYGTFIKQRINKKRWQTFYDPIALVPYMLRTNGHAGFITYDDAFSTYSRVWYADWQKNLGGTFMWSLDADYDGQSQDLLDAMYSATLGPAH